MPARTVSRGRSAILLAALFGLALGASSIGGCGGDTPLPLGTVGAACYGGGKGPCGRCNAELICSDVGICFKPVPNGPPAPVCPDAGGGDAAAGRDGATGPDGGAPDVGAEAPAPDGGAAGMGGAAGSDGAADQAPATDGGGDASGDAVDGGDA